MDKIAQKRKFKRNLVNKIEEATNFSGKIMERFSPEFNELMDLLREVDDKVREEASDLKDLLKVAESNFNRREYITCFSYLARFHEKIDNINMELSRLNKSVDLKHQKFLFEDLDKEHIDYLLNKKNRYLKNKEAGLGVVKDWWHNLTSDRGRALSAWEKRFPKYAKELKSELKNLLNKSESLHNFLKISFKAMASFRAIRKIEDYVKIVSKIKDKFKDYDRLFLSVYNKQIKNLMEYQKSLEALNQETNIEDVETKNEPISFPKPQNDNMSKEEVSNNEFGFGQIPVVLDEEKKPNNEKLISEIKEISPSKNNYVENTIKQLPIPEAFNDPFEKDPATLVSKTLEEAVAPTVFSPMTQKSQEQVHSSNLPLNLVNKKPVSIPFDLVKEEPLDLLNPKIPKPPIVPKISEEEVAQEIAQLDKENDERKAKQDAETVRPKKTAKQDHSLFLKTIQALQNKHPFVLAKEIIIYAKSIEKSDPKTSKILLNIAKQVING